MAKRNINLELKHFIRKNKRIRDRVEILDRMMIAYTFAVHIEPLWSQINFIWFLKPAFRYSKTK